MEESVDRKSGKKALIAGILAAVLAIAGVFAYLTATDTAVNKLSVASQLDIEVVEPNWHEENAQNMLPTQEVTKDPAIHNKTNIPAWVFADVVIPQKNIVVADETGNKQPQEVVDLFSYDVKPGWTLKDTIQDTDAGTVTYRYVYNEQLAGDGTTPAIFDKVKVCNFVDEQIDTASAAQQIIINGVGVQASAFDSVDAAYADYFGASVPPTSDGVDVVVNNTEIVTNEQYSIKEVESNKEVIITPAQTAEQVTFENVSLTPETEYKVVDNTDNSVGEFTTTDDVSTDIVVGNDSRQAFAVYSADDKSLNFYNRTVMPSVGETFDGKITTNVYDNVENTAISSFPAWFSNNPPYESSVVIDEDIQPLSTAHWFRSCSKLKYVDISKLDTSKTTDMQYMFASVDGQNGIVGLDSLNTSHVTNMMMMFNCCYANQLNVSSWDMSNVESILGMFVGASNVVSLDLSDWTFNKSNVVLGSPFSNCTSLTNIKLFDFSVPTDNYSFSRMFQKCESLSVIDISMWKNLDKVQDWSLFADNCTNLTTIYVSSDFVPAENVYDGNSFQMDMKLVGGNGSKYSEYQNTSNMLWIDGKDGKPGYLTAK